MTGDDHGHGGTSGRFEGFVKQSPPGCSVNDWQCIRGTSNIFAGSVDRREAVQWQAEGFEIGLHVYTGCRDWPAQGAGLLDGRGAQWIKRHLFGERIPLPNGARIDLPSADRLYRDQLRSFAATYPELPTPTTNRIDCVTWGDYDTQPRVELRHGIRLDENYYYWPPAWVRDRPGLFTGSGMPMRFATLDGRTIDVYQAATQVTDESHQNIPRTIQTLLANATGPKEYYSAITVNMHTDKPSSPGADAIVAAAKEYGAPVISARQLLRWLDGRNNSSFENLRWGDGTLSFSLRIGEGANGIQIMVPAKSAANTLSTIQYGNVTVPFHVESRMGTDYALFQGRPGGYSIAYTTAVRDRLSRRVHGS